MVNYTGATANSNIDNRSSNYIGVMVITLTWIGRFLLEKSRGLDEHVRSSGLGGKLVPYVKRVAAEICARALFYPTLFVNIGRNVINPDYHWLDRIDQDIFLGAVPLPGNVPLLKELGINAVVSLTQSYETLVPTSTYQAHGIQHLEMPTTDYLYAPPQEEICEALYFIHKNARHGGTTLVHCKAGRARNTTVVLCYLVKYRKMTPETALQHVMSIRP
ncbi:hypothetical protein BRADI_2g46150v3 [Brachypodium distachyon]|uniref:Tyrosine specific protein phosphatases domain-containing protein n=2 Tax=Brachypodium distachyon TaxID=15368 RepID=I1HQ86_BRADI|nr:hypothetical protein BRADI_2g46150v3 [Brachypodium distachyon]